MNEEIKMESYNANELADISRKEFERQVLSKGFNTSSSIENERTLMSLATELLDGLNVIDDNTLEIGYRIMGKDIDDIASVKEPSVDTKNVREILVAAVRTMRRVNSKVLTIKDRL